MPAFDANTLRQAAERFLGQPRPVLPQNWQPPHWDWGNQNWGHDWDLGNRPARWEDWRNAMGNNGVRPQQQPGATTETLNGPPLGRTTSDLPGGGQRVVDVTMPGVRPPPLPTLPTTINRTPTAGGGMSVTVTGQPGTIHPGTNYGNIPITPQMALAAGPVPMMGYISTPGGTFRNPNAPSFATATNPSANPTGWLAATYAAHNAAYPNAPAPAPVSVFRPPTVQMHPGG